MENDWILTIFFKPGAQPVESTAILMTELSSELEGYLNLYSEDDISHVTIVRVE